MKFCKKCKATNQYRLENYCAICGTKLEEITKINDTQIEGELT